MQNYQFRLDNFYSMGSCNRELRELCHYPLRIVTGITALGNYLDMN